VHIIHNIIHINVSITKPWICFCGREGGKSHTYLAVFCRKRSDHLGSWARR